MEEYVYYIYIVWTCALFVCMIYTYILIFYPLPKDIAKVVLKARGSAVVKAVSCTEIVKRRVLVSPTVHQSHPQESM